MSNPYAALKRNKYKFGFNIPIKTNDYLVLHRTNQLTDVFKARVARSLNNVVQTHSVRLTTHPLVGWISTVLRNGAPWKPRSRNGMSNSTSCFVNCSTFSQKLLNADFSLCRSSRSAYNIAETRTLLTRGCNYTASQKSRPTCFFPQNFITCWPIFSSQFVH